MSKKKFALWAFLSIFLFVFVAAGCSGGGGGDGSGGGGSSGGSGEYSFNDLEGTWSLVPGTGHGTASGNYAGYPISGTAECQMLEIAIANIRVNSDATLADAAFAMSTYWTFTAETPYGSFSGYDFEGEFSSGADDVEDPPKLRKTGSNVFVYEYGVNGGDIYSSTVTITLTSSTTANVRQTFDYTGGELAGTVDKAEMTYSLRKTSGGSLDNSGGTEDVVEGQGTKLEDVYDYTTVKYELLSVKSVAGEEIYLNTSNNEKAIMRNIELRIAADALPANTSVVVSGVIDPPFPSGDWEFVTWPFAVDIDGFSGSSLSISLVIPYRDEQFNHLVITDPSVLKLYVYYDDAWHEGSINNIDTNARRIHAGISKPGIVAIAFPMDSELNSQRTSNAVDLQNIVTRMVRRPDGEIPKEGDILIRKHDSGRWTPGHVGIVTGVSETGETQYVAEANPPLKGDGKVSTHVYGGILGVFGGNTYMGAFYPAGVTDAQRQKAVQWAKGQIGKKYVNMRYFPGSRYGMMHEDFVKGNVEEAFNCTGLVEAAYEYGAGLDIVKSTPASQIWVDIPSEGVCVPLSEVIGNKEYRDALKDKGFWELASEWNLFIFPENNPEEAERRFAEEADLGEALTPAKYYRILNAAASTPDNPDQDFITVTFKVYHNGAPVKDALVSVYLDSGRGYLAGRDRTDANGEFKSAYMPGTHFVEAQNSDNTASSALRQITITSETNVKPIFLESINSGGTTPGNGSTQWYDNYQSAATFTITNADQLAGLAYLVNNGTDFLNKTVYIDRDIYLTGKEWTPIGTHQNLFRGKLDGNGHTIWDMTITRTNSDKHAGLFGAVGAEGFITSLNMAGVNINVSSVSGSRAGSIAGYSAGRINACAFDGSISAAQFAGGVVGATEGGFVASCSTFDRHIDSVSVSALIAGGIVGFDGGDTAISGCRVNGAVFAANEGGNVGSITLRPGVFMSLSGPLAWAGGIAGSGDGEIEECTFSGYVFAELHGSNPYANEVSAAGGVAGCANGIVKNSRSSAYISAYADSGMVMTGGIVGLMNGAGEVSGCEKNSGLIVGGNSTGTTASGLVYKGGIIAYNYDVDTSVSGNEFSQSGTLVEYGIGYDDGPPSNRGCRVNP